MTAAVTTLVQGLREEELRAKRIIQRNRRYGSSGLAEQIKQGLHHVVGLNWAPGHAYNTYACLGFPTFAKVLWQACTAGGVTFHRVNTTIGSASPSGNYGPGMRGKLVNPFTSRDGLAGSRIRAHCGPVTLRFVRFIGNGAFNYQNERP
jgi:hypothetical protein